MTTHADAATERPPDLVDRQFVATRPNQLWVADFTYVATWRGLRVRRVRHRRLRAPDRRLARVGVAADRLRAGRPGASDLRPPRATGSATWCITAIAARSLGSRCRRNTALFD